MRDPRRRLGLQRNELRRHVDRVQRWAALAILALLLAFATPVAIWAGAWAYGSGMKTERAEHANRRAVVATVLATGGIDAASDRYVRETVKATWKPPTGGRQAKARTGTLPSWKGAEVGAKKRIWVTLDGTPTSRPRPHSRTVTDAAYAAGTAVLVSGFPFLVTYLLVRRRCNRCRYELWDMAWEEMDAQRGRNSY